VTSSPERAFRTSRAVLSAEAETAIPAHVPHVIDVPRQAAGAFACNVVAFGSDVVAPLGAERIRPAHADAGFHLHTVDVGEFIKAGGGVRCLSLIQDAPAARARATACSAPPVHGSP
jgi:N-dimethylarginine dimethylaminohydrolase